jgi:dUTP pyrophosphatase
MKIKIKKVYPDAIVPSYQRFGDAAMDIYSYDEAILKPGEGKSFRTGIAVEVPTGYGVLVWDRSGLAFKHGLTRLGGLIDSNYRGEIGIFLFNTSDKEYKIEKGHRIAQFIIQKVEQIDFEEVDELSETERGDNWQGSSGY